MEFKKGNEWALKSQMEGKKRAKRFHTCLDCRHHQTANYKLCPKCGSKNRQYFMSETEFNRGMKLMIKQMAGTIERLRFQPRYELKVNGRLICTYVADADYYEAGALVVEDSKPQEYMDDGAKVKIKLFEALFNIVVKIPQRKSGNRSDAKAPTLI